jgi:hypothetical protein
MAPRPLIYDFLDNLKVPFLGVFGGSCIAASACAIGILPASLIYKVSSLGVVSGIATIAVMTPVIINDERRLRERDSQQQNRELVLTGNPPRSESATTQEVHTYRQVEPQPQFLRWSRPAACKNCIHYNGHIFRSHWGDVNVESVETQFICAMYPYGPDGETCPDWEGPLNEYRLIRLQGSGLSCLYFVESGFSKSVVDETLANGVEIDTETDAEITQALCRKFERKSINGLPGCIFKTKETDINLAFQELLDSCSE